MAEHPEAVGAVATRYVVTKTLTDQNLPPTRHEFSSMLASYLFMIEAINTAVRTRRAFDIYWVSDDHVALTSPTGRFLEEYRFEMEVAHGHST